MEAYDSLTNGTFTLRAALLWTINEFPAYGNLSGRMTKGFYACPHCNIDTCHLSLKRSRKLCYMGHRRFLDRNNAFRRNKAGFNGKVEMRAAPKVRSGAELLHQMRKLKVQLGKHIVEVKGKGMKRKTKNKPGTKKKSCLGWKKRSIFFKLPYWEKLLLRHNLDVMHIDKIVCDCVVGTLLGIDGKSKDSANARWDLEDMNIRPHLHRRKVGDKYDLPAAPFYMDKKAKEKFCKVLSMVKVLDGYAANISRQVDVVNGKISGLKSHDCHILMQQLLPLAIRKSLPREMCILLIGLSNFFKDVCSKDASFEDFERLESEVILLLCRLKRVFMPAFFDIMVHLIIHLPYEAAIAGPVHYCWMYPIERNLERLKSYVRNRARPEGSIAEAYIADECMNFCARYLEGVETRENRLPKNYDGGDYDARKGLPILSTFVHIFGGEKPVFLNNQKRVQAHEYILFNCDEVSKYAMMHKKVLIEQNPILMVSDIEKLHKGTFVKWFTLNGEEVLEEDDNHIILKVLH